MSEDSDATFSALHTARGLDELRERTIKELGYTPDFTCTNCVWAPTCIFAYDGYNTDGDCLAAK